MDKDKANTPEENLESMMGDLNDTTDSNISLEDLKQRIKGKMNKKFDEPTKEPKDRSKPEGSDSIKNTTDTNPSTMEEAGWRNKGKKLKEAFSVPQGTDFIEFILQNMETINTILPEKFYGSGVPITFIREGLVFSGIYLIGDNYNVLLEFVGTDDSGTSLISASKFSLIPANNYQADFTVDFTSDTLDGCMQELASALQSQGSTEVMTESKKTDVMEFLGTADTSQPISSLLRAYNNWAEKNGASPVSEAYFRNVLRSANNGGPAQSAGGPNIKHYQDTFETPEEYDDFEKEVMENDVLLKYEMMGQIVKAIVQKDPMYKNVFIYGTGGVGKTFTVNQVINKYDTSKDVVTYKGAISGFTGLLQVLWENRDDKIIVFDDNDGILTGAQQNAANLLKGAMEMDDPRILSYTRFKRGSKKESTMKESLDSDYDSQIMDLMDAGYSEEDARANVEYFGDYDDEFQIPDYENDTPEEEILAGIERLNNVSREQAIEIYEDAIGPLEESRKPRAILSLKTALGDTLYEAYDYDDEEDEEDVPDLSELAKGGVEDGLLDIDEFKKTYTGSLDPEVDPAFGLGPDDEVPDQFQFNSRIIFISNLMTVPQPLLDRTYSIGLLLTKEQIMDLIESKAGNLMTKYPQVTLEDKLAVIKFMRTYLHRAGKSPTFRGFEQLVAIYKSGHPEKKKHMYLTFTAGGDMKSKVR